MRLAAAILSVLTAVALVLLRPRLRGELRFGPTSGAAVGAVVMLATRVVAPHDLLTTLTELYRPLVGLAALLALTSLAHLAGIFDRLARIVEVGTRGSVVRAFLTVFVVAAFTSAAFNNDAAILLLTPLLVPLLRRLYPLRPYLVLPFSFAVFMAAGVAPFSTSNPMNLLVSERAGIGFNSYAARMVPVALACWLTSFVVLRVIFHHELTVDPVPARGPEREAPPPLPRGGKRLLTLLVLVFASYPVVSYLDGPVWAVAAIGAALAVLLCWSHGLATPRDAARGVAWDVLGFLFCAFVLARGLENAGVIAPIANLYAGAGGPGAQLAVVGTVSAAGSAIVNNHPMAMLNSVAVQDLPERRLLILSALVGGDLGPRLLPIGSLAGLLWLEMLRRSGIEVPLSKFCRVGVAVTVPTLAVCLGVLYLVAG